jgi:hypothetical protein
MMRNGPSKESDMRASALVFGLFLLGQNGAGWVSLFDGTSLDQWVTTGNANWRVVDGVIEADMPRGYLVSKASYTDFELRMDVWVRPESNAGIMFRITDVKDPGIQNAYELNINDQRKDQSGRTGSIVNVSKPLVQYDSGNKWTTVELMVRGPKFAAKMNGTVVTEATDTKYARGPIAIQAAGGLVRYRNIQIRELR